jgi:hypothetical protein
MLLLSWPYQEGQNLRIVRGDDGRELLQVRLPLGLEQFELTGRPDGQRPSGRESLLEYHVERLAANKTAGSKRAFKLSAAQCADLFNEGTIYYFRYLHCFQLGRFHETVRDTERNLQLFDFVHHYAAREEDRMHLEKWRPYVLRINASAKAMIELGQQHHARAFQIAQEAADAVESLDEMDDETFQFERKRSVLALRELAAQIEKTRPITELERLERELKQAVAAQEFERAAQLRDRLRQLRLIP